MKIIPWILIGGRVFALAFGLTVLGSSCGDTNKATTGTLSQEEAKRNEETQKAMEAASKAAHAKKK